jgi:hypothetical protein
MSERIVMTGCEVRGENGTNRAEPSLAELTCYMRSSHGHETTCYMRSSDGHETRSINKPVRLSLLQREPQPFSSPLLA